MKKNLKNIFSIKNKVILITGSSAGMAKPLRKYLHENGAKIINVDNTPERKQLKNFFKVDLSIKEEILSLSNKIKNKYKKLDAIVNFVGVSDEKNFEYNFKVNIFSIYYLVNSLLDLLKKSQCSIVNITSLNSELGFENNPGYNSSKGALKMLSKSLAVDLAKYNIRVNNVGPGYIKTKMTKKSFMNKNKRNERISRMLIKRYGNPEEVVGAIIFLITNASSYITGQDLYVDGGFLTKGI